ncbi:MAG: bifunctional diaminohydroxyphosphoribosylaminopyrimidine deaminase/5-amino-6-(5-phosphoribosylamino)uracil reductase RibD [Limnohabitans sp.]
MDDPLNSSPPPSQAMQMALTLAAQAMRITSPNPRVGCVIVDAQGQVLGLGHTQRAGGPHAEIMALQDAQAKGYSVKGATAYVTLEPCAHQGRTGPCCDAMVQAQLGKVVAAISDPNPAVSGKGFERLKAAGIDVQVGDGAAQAAALNPGFLCRMTRQKPWVRMKIAASLDGQTALTNGKSQWITGPEARADGHAWRARACAVLTGIGTVLEDDPLLDLRLCKDLENPPRMPHLVIVDSRLETPLHAKLFQHSGPSAPNPRQIWIYGAVDKAHKKAALEAQGAHVTLLPNAQGKVDLPALFSDLARREVNEVHVEAGHKLNGSLIREGCVDEFLVYLAPQMLGIGQGMALWGPLEDLSQGVTLTYSETQLIGKDLRVLAKVQP